MRIFPTPLRLAVLIQFISLSHGAVDGRPVVAHCAACFGAGLCSFREDGEWVADLCWDGKGGEGEGGAEEEGEWEDRDAHIGV